MLAFQDLVREWLGTCLPEDLTGAAASFASILTNLFDMCGAHTRQMEG